MVSCGKLGGAKWAADGNSIYVTKDLQVQSAMVFTAPEANELYSKEELAAEAGEWIRDYNVANGAEAISENTDGKAKLPVALKACSLEGQTGKLIFDGYNTADRYGGCRAGGWRERGELHGARWQYGGIRQFDEGWLSGGGCGRRCDGMHGGQIGCCID